MLSRLMLATTLTAAAMAPAGQVLAGPPIVQTEAGAVKGEGGAVNVFRGIPYAAPPVGRLRWAPPEPAASWTGVRDGTKFGADCVQPPYYPELRGAGQSEDCLTLNVWTPSPERAEPKRPVMVWIYGGGFVNGSGSHPTYDGAEFAKRGVVLVTLNYRMGVFGFMAHPGLSAESPTKTSGNYGLLDQLAALRWVNRNIATFGGDPDRVTVFGQSAGAMCIEALLTSLESKGLFRQVILESVGAMRRPVMLAQAEASGLKMGPDIAVLRSLSAAELSAKMNPTEGAFRDVTGPREFGPVVDGVLLPMSDRQAFTSGHAFMPPMIVGSTENEGGAFTRSAPIKTVEAFNAYLTRNFPGREAEAKRAYSADSDADVKRELDRLFSDTQFNYGTREMLRLVVRQQPKVWRYLFSARRDATGPAPVHGDELQYVFGTLAGVHKGRTRPFDGSDVTLSRAMTDTWVRFATTGDPNGGGLPVWPAYDPALDNYLGFGRSIAVGHTGASPQLDFLDAYFAGTDAAK